MRAGYTTTVLLIFLKMMLFLIIFVDITFRIFLSSPSNILWIFYCAIRGFCFFITLEVDALLSSSSMPLVRVFSSHWRLIWIFSFLLCALISTFTFSSLLLPSFVLKFSTSTIFCFPPLLFFWLLTFYVKPPLSPFHKKVSSFFSAHWPF